MVATPITTTITTPRSDKVVPPSVGVEGEGLGCRVGNDKGLGRVVGEAVGALDWPSVLGEAVGKGLGAGVGCAKVGAGDGIDVGAKDGGGVGEEVGRGDGSDVGGKEGGEVGVVV